jgi:hypothetical protein
VGAFDWGVDAFGSTTFRLWAGVFGRVLWSCAYGAGSRVGAASSGVAILLALLALSVGRNRVVFFDFAGCVIEVHVGDT